MPESDCKSAKSINLSFQGGRSGHKNKRIKVNEEEDGPVQQLLTGFEQTGAVYTDTDAKTVAVEGAMRKVIPTQGNDFRGMGPRAYNPQRYTQLSMNKRCLSHYCKKQRICASSSKACHEA